MKASAGSTLALALGLLCTVQARMIVSFAKRGECPQRISWCDGPPPYNHTCNNDYECEGTQKCCIEVCRKECKDIVPVKPKPGVCPEDPRGCNVPEEDECYGDNHCPWDLKCCHFHCSLKCKNVTAAAVKPKPGMCPEDPHVCHLNETDKCYGDNDCPMDLKCCVFHCGLKCKNALTAAAVKPKPGQCPAYDIGCIKAQDPLCQSDGDCPGDEKCCHFHCGFKCVNATAAPEKSGVCPLPPSYPVCVFPTPPWNKCATDQECPDDQKCCDSGCSPQCKKPLQDKSGHCPPFARSICPYAFYETCSSDRQCEGTDRCCCYGNLRMECTRAVKLGECPQRISWCDRQPPYNHTCNNDYDCQGTQKCCIEVCTQECKDIVPVKPKPGMCPEDPRRCHLNETDKCYGDKDCPGDQKCCFFQCGLKCKNAMTAAAAPEKSGSCPLSPKYLVCIVPPHPPTRNKCATDQECPDDQKCCDYGCNPQCKKPLQVKPGTCPAAKLPCTDNSTPDNCTDDGDCEGRKKCCEGCGKHKRCTSPDPGQLISCPSYDRSICALVDAAPDKCQRDSDCSETQHCCCSNCRRDCIPKVKPGACPAAKLPCTDYSTPDNCTDDGDCEGRKKCCEGCGKHKRCRSPDPVKSGACPDIKASCELPLQDAECKDDLDCGGLKKCCPMCGNQCMNPASVRPGFCPVDLMLEQQCGSVLRNNCTSDGDCGDGEKCCLFGCGMQCVMALDVAPGSCPGMKAKCDPEKLVSKCKADDDCDQKQKCCELCGKKCLAAVSDHAGFCPVSRFRNLILCTPNNTEVNCTSDLDCPPDQKCCTELCKSACVKPLQEKTGECPAAEPDQPTATYEPSDICNQCNDDKDCPQDMKCCSGSKGKECKPCV